MTLTGNSAVSALHRHGNARRADDDDSCRKLPVVLGGKDEQMRSGLQRRSMSVARRTTGVPAGIVTSFDPFGRDVPSLARRASVVWPLIVCRREPTMWLSLMRFPQHTSKGRSRAR